MFRFNSATIYLCMLAMRRLNASSNRVVVIGWGVQYVTLHGDIIANTIPERLFNGGHVDHSIIG